MTEFGGFGILATAGPMRLGGRAFDMLTALIEASLAVVSKDALLGRAQQGRIVDQNPQPGTRFRVTAQIAISVSAAAQSTQALVSTPERKCINGPE